MTRVPPGWSLTPIGSLCALQNGRAFKATDWSTSGLPIVRIQNLNRPGASFNHFLGDVDPKVLLVGGELLFAWSGTPGTSFGAHIWKGGKAVLNQHIFRVDFDEDYLDKRFFRYAINQRLEQLIDTAHGGVGLRHVTKGKFEATDVLVPPRREQARIADKLDALLARVDASRERLDRVPGILKRFRQAVLAAATSGELTREWREERAIEFAWRKSTLGAVGDVTGGITKNAGRVNTTLMRRYLRVANVYANRLHLEDIAEIATTPEEFARTRLQPGDVLIVEGNGSIDQIGRAALWRGEIDDCAHQNHLIRWRTVGTVLPDFALYWLLSPAGRGSLVESAKSSAGLHTLSLSKVSAVPLLIPTLEEQAEVVRRVDELFQMAGILERRLVDARSCVVRSTPSVLAKAFRGELVPQDPNDEPASELLARLRAGRSTDNGTEVPKRSGTPGGSTKGAGRSKKPTAKLARSRS